jgi:hypothetical protein
MTEIDDTQEIPVVETARNSMRRWARGVGWFLMLLAYTVFWCAQGLIYGYAIWGK